MKKQNEKVEAATTGHAAADLKVNDLTKVYPINDAPSTPGTSDQPLFSSNSDSDCVNTFKTEQLPGKSMCGHGHPPGLTARGVGKHFFAGTGLIPMRSRFPDVAVDLAKACEAAMDGTSKHCVATIVERGFHVEFFTRKSAVRKTEANQITFSWSKHNYFRLNQWYALAKEMLKIRNEI